MAEIFELQTGYNKRFPSDFCIDYKTFLNDKSVDAEIYAYFAAISIVKKDENGINRTYVPKKAINKTKVAEALGVSRPTVIKKFNILMDRGYFEQAEDGGMYINYKEKCYLDIPIETLWYLQDTLKEEVIKVYIYLGVRYNYKHNYEFTLAELGAHCGVDLKSNYGRNYAKLNNILYVLKDCGLLDYKDVSLGRHAIKQIIRWELKPNSLKEIYQPKSM